MCCVSVGDELEKRHEILNRLFHGNMDMTKPAFIEPPLTVDYVRRCPASYMHPYLHFVMHK